MLRTEWGPTYEGVLRAIGDADVVLLSGAGTATEWTFEVRADEREQVAAFQAYCDEHGVAVTLESLQALSKPGADQEYGLTEAQREALVLAYERGYYRSPRETTLAELAAEVGITGQSFGSRLRRGIHRLVGATLARPER